MNSENIFRELSELIPGGVNSPFLGYEAVGGVPPVLERGEGAYVYDVEGRRYLDLLGAWGPLILGHAPPRVVAVATEAVRSGAVFGASCRWELELARRVVQAFPSIDMVRFVNSGTEAVMSAVRLARGFTRRSRIVRFEGSYHGHLDSLLETVGTEAPPDISLAEAGVPLGVAADTITLPYNDAEALEQFFRSEGHSIAAVLVEPVTGSMTVVEPEPAFLQALQTVPRQYGALLVFDEVITGVRLARGGAQERYGVLPDLTCLGKALSGGFAIGAYGGRRDIMQRLSPIGPVYQAGTYSGNLLSMRCGIETMDAVAEPNFYAHLEQLGRQLAEGWRGAAARNHVAAWIAQVGSIVGIAFTEGPIRTYRDAIKADAALFARFFHGMRERGVMLPTSYLDVVCLSAAHTAADIEMAIGAADETFAEIAAHTQVRAR